MILVTVGTTQFPFITMRDIVLDIINANSKDEKIIFQHGNTLPIEGKKNIVNVAYLPYQQMQKNISSARLIICHGGPATVYQVLNQSKTPIVIPRQKKYQEHVSDHQVDFCEYLYKNKLAMPYKEGKKYIVSTNSPSNSVYKNSTKSIPHLISYLHTLV